MELFPTKTFQRDYEKSPKLVQRQLDRNLEFLLKNSYHPSLGVKKTKGEIMKGYTNVFEGRINKNYRFLFLIEPDCYVLLRCGKHNDFF
jgi:mRNA-degrading endonuclease RelE of RelBE toxin-antitoxin system